MFYPPQLFLKDRYIASSLVVSAVLLAIAWWATVTRVHPNADQVYLHYSIIFGIDLLGEWWKLWLVPVGATSLLVFNLVVSYAAYGRDKAVGRLISVLTICLEVFLLTGLLLIIGLNG